MKRTWMAMSASAALLGASVVSAQPPRGEGRPTFPPPSPIIAALDTDGDGVLSADEIKNAPKALLTLDRDGDGKLSAEELAPRGPGGRPAPGGFGGRPGGFGGGDPAQFIERLMNLDADGDGKLSKEELGERMGALLERADTNNDGYLDKAEIEALSERMSQFRPGEGRPGAEGRPGGRGRPEGAPGAEGRPGRPGGEGRPGRPGGEGRPRGDGERPGRPERPDMN